MLNSHLYTERLTVGYEDIHTDKEITDKTKKLTDKFNNFFDEMEENGTLILKSEIVPEAKTTKYFLEVQMSTEAAASFILYFGSELSEKQLFH